MMKGNKNLEKFPSSLEIGKLREELQKLKPRTEFAKTLWRLSRKNLENSPTILDADEIISELGRSRSRLYCRQRRCGRRGDSADGFDG